MLEARLAAEGLPALAAELTVRAPETAARTDRANPRRVVRALERVLLVGDRPPPAPAGWPAPVAWIGLRRERARHDAAIAARARAQLTGGLLAEAAALRARYPETLPAFSAMGYREAFALLDGRLDLDGAVAEDARRTVAYARRQATWFRAEAGIAWLDGDADPLPGALAAAQALLEAPAASPAGRKP